MCISVVVPVLDEAEALPRQLEALRRLAAQVVLVDGGSIDATTTLLAASGLPWITAPRGRASQMNAGAAASTGGILMFVHADTVLPRDALSSVRRAVRSGAVGGAFDVKLDAGGPVFRLVGRMISLRSRVTGVATGDQALFVTRAAFDQLGGFADMPLFEDIDFSRRLRRMGTVARLRREVTTSARRWQRRGTMRTILWMWALRASYYAGVDPAWLARHYRTAR